MPKQPTQNWQKAIQKWRALPEAERHRRHLESIPRSVANSMAIEGEPVDEQWLRQRLNRQMQQRATSKPPQAS